MKKRAIKIPNWLLCLIVTFPLLFGMLWGYPTLLDLDLKVYDKLSQLRQSDMPSPVVIIEIDHESIKELGPWPWPRAYIADIIKTVSNAKAKAIGLDILYNEKEINPAEKPKIRQWCVFPVEVDYIRVPRLGQIRTMARDAT